MSRSILGAIFVGLVAFVVGLGTSNLPVNAQPRPKVQQWEYKFLKAPVTAKEISEELNRLGAEGWEYADGFGASEYLFKRPKR